MKSITVDVPDFVLVEGSELGNLYGAGRVIEAWRNNIKVEFNDNGRKVLGCYSIVSNKIKAVEGTQPK